MVATISVGDHPYCAALSADGSRLYVSNTQGDTLSIVDTKTQRVVATKSVAATPEGVGFSATTQRIYVTSWMENEVTVLDASSNEVITYIPTGKESRSFGQFILENR